MTGNSRKKPKENDRLDGQEEPRQFDLAGEMARKYREAAARVFAPIRQVRRKAGKPTCIADVCRELVREWWELCVGTWREEECEHRNYDAIRSDPLTVALYGREWEEWPRNYATLKECIETHCRGLEKILLARLEQEGEPKLWDDEDEEDSTVDEDDQKEEESHEKEGP